MLSLTLLPGEYLTIGDNVVLQYDCTTELLAEMDGGDDDVQALRRQLNHMFPPAAVQAE